MARIGLGLARIRQGDLETGRNDIEAAVALDPNRSLLRSYLGKAYFEERTTNPLTYLQELVTNFPNQENTLAAEQFAIAKELDPKDPTPFLYDAIRLQSENRPVEALRDLERSIELNDNRAVYRSRELLDQDRAARGTSLARIYNDLGFEQLGINEATRSLSLDPGSAAAHRFLSDTYLGRPRHEIARVSELLQAQLLQDININPVQPSLSATNLNVFTRGGPASAGFNEFTPLFERDQAQLNVSGLVGSHGTWADEAVVSGLYDRFSISAGQFHSETDGFRRNFDLQNDVYNLFAQAAVTPHLNIQAELTTRKTEQGDLALGFSTATYSPDLHVDSEQDTARGGVRFSPTSRSDLVGSVIYNNRHYKSQDIGFGDFRNNRSAVQTEALYIYRGDLFQVMTGLASFDINLALKRPLVAGLSAPSANRSRDDAEQNSAYVYSILYLPWSLTWTIGLSYDRYHQEGRSLLFPENVEKISPKLGVVWDVADNVYLRLAAFQTFKPPLVTNQTIQPTQVAGFNQFFDDPDATTSQRYAAAVDAQLKKNVYGGVELSRRGIEVPVGPFNEKWDEELYRAYLYWTPHPRWSASVELQFEVFDSHSEAASSYVPSQLETVSLPVGVYYFSPLGVFAGAAGTYVHQDIRRDEAARGSDFVVFDAATGFRFPQRRGSISLEVRNLFDTGFHFQDESFRAGSDLAAITPFIPERAIVVRGVLNF